MASTSQLLTWIELELHGWNREGPRGTRALFNEAHKILMQQEAEQNIIIDPATGDLPFLATTAGTYRYNVPAVGGQSYWLIKAILIDRDTTLSGLEWQFEDFYFANNRYTRLLNMRSIAAGSSPLVVASVTFIRQDPGNSTATYRIFGFRQPVEILSDSIQHQMPGSTDIEYLMPATIMLIRSIDDDKKMAESRAYIEREMKPKVMKGLDSGEQGNSIFVVKRSF